MYQQRFIWPAWCLMTSTLLFSVVAQAGPIPDDRPAGRDRSADQPAHPDRAVTSVDQGETIEIDGVAPDLDGVHPDAARTLDDPGFVTVIRVEEHLGETLSLAEVATESVGVRARSTGGLGSFSSISVRGADAGHTTILVDGIPLSRLASVGFDLSRFDLGSVSEIELYRGAVPADFGGAAIGGAVNLITRTGAPESGHALSASAGGGSFGARHARARWLGGSRSERRGHHLSVSYAGADGDFSYFNDRGTSLDRDDDEITRRRNNAYDQLDAVARLRGQRGALEYRAGLRSAWKRQGVTGSASAQSRRSELSSMTHIADGGVRTPQLLGRPGLAGRASLYAIFERQRYRDPDGEIGIGEQDRRYLSASLGTSASASRAFGHAHRAELGLDARLDLYEDLDVDASPGDAPESRGMRSGAAMILDHAWSPTASILVNPSLRVDWLRTVPVVDRNRPGAETESTRDDLVASPRLSARVRLAESVALKGSIGRYMRAPTLLELFGDRGFTVGNPALRTETGVSGDVGAVLALLGTSGSESSLAHLDRVYVEAALFARRAHDTIVFVSSGGPAATALNLGESRAYGVEGGGSVRVARTVTLRGNYTYLVARQRSPLVSYDDKELPQRPRHQIYGRVDIEGRALDRAFAVWGDVSYSAVSYLDAAELTPIPARTLMGAGLRGAIAGDLLLAFEVKNLADARIESVNLEPPPRPDLTTTPRAISDFAGYPLPGRAFYLTLAWSS